MQMHLCNRLIHSLLSSHLRDLKVGLLINQLVYTTLINSIIAYLQGRFRIRIIILTFFPQYVHHIRAEWDHICRCFGLWNGSLIL